MSSVAGAKMGGTTSPTTGDRSVAESCDADCRRNRRASPTLSLRGQQGGSVVRTSATTLGASATIGHTCALPGYIMNYVDRHFKSAGDTETGAGLGVMARCQGQGQFWGVGGVGERLALSSTPSECVVDVARVSRAPSTLWPTLAGTDDHTGGRRQPHCRSGSNTCRVKPLACRCRPG